MKKASVGSLVQSLSVLFQNVFPIPYQHQKHIRNDPWSDQTERFRVLIQTQFQDKKTGIETMRELSITLVVPREYRRKKRNRFSRKGRYKEPNSEWYGFYNVSRQGGTEYRTSEHEKKQTFISE